MGRPLKPGADWYPQDADAHDGRTLTILFNHFGHEGISAWWGLLGKLTGTGNHVICIRNPEDYEFLAAKLHFSPERLTAILAKMAELEAIDRELHKAGYLWCQNLVNRLAPIYEKRHQVLPTRPIPAPDTGVSGTEIEKRCQICQQPLQNKRSDALFCSDSCRLKAHRATDKENSRFNGVVPDGKISGAETGIIGTETPDKVTEGAASRVEVVEKKIPLTPLPPKSEICCLYENTIGLLTGAMAETLKEAETVYPQEWFAPAFKEAKDLNKRSWRYVERILERWAKEGRDNGQKPRAKAPPDARELLKQEQLNARA